MFDFLHSLDKPTSIIELISYCVVIICLTIYSIYRIRSNKKNGGSWRQELKDIKTSTKDINIKLSNHIIQSDERHKKTQEQIKELKKDKKDG